MEVKGPVCTTKTSEAGNYVEVKGSVCTIKMSKAGNNMWK